MKWQLIEKKIGQDKKTVVAEFKTKKEAKEFEMWNAACRNRLMSVFTIEKKIKLGSKK